MNTMFKLALLKFLSGYLDARTISFNLNPGTIPTEEGDVYWNDDEGTVTINLANGVKLTIGTELYLRAANRTGDTMLNGTVVYVSGAQGNRPKVDMAVNTDVTKARRTIGILTHDADDNGKAFITTNGEVHDVDTGDFNEGDCLWLSDVPGEYTNIEPENGKFRVKVGMVIVSHETEGVICVNVDEYIYMFGDLINNHRAVFEDNGFLRFDNNAQAYQDIDFPIIIRTTGPNIPTLTVVQDGLTAPQWAVNDTNMCEGQERIHPWAEGTDSSWHIHIITNGLDATNRYVKFQIDWFWVNVGEQLSATITQSYEYEIPADTPDKTMLLIPIYTWSNPTGKIAGHVYAKLTRIAAAGTAPSNDPWCTMLQMHVKCDGLGSRSVSAK